MSEAHISPAHRKRLQFRELLARPGMTVMPGGFSPMYAKAAQLGDDLGGGQGLGQAQHHRAAAFCLGARGDQRQMHLVRGRDQPCGQAAVMGQKRCVILARVPIQRWQ